MKQLLVQTFLVYICISDFPTVTSYPARPVPPNIQNCKCSKESLQCCNIVQFYRKQMRNYGKRIYVAKDVNKWNLSDNTTIDKLRYYICNDEICKFFNLDRDDTPEENVMATEKMGEEEGEGKEVEVGDEEGGGIDPRQGLAVEEPGDKDKNNEGEMNDSGHEEEARQKRNIVESCCQSKQEIIEVSSITDVEYEDDVWYPVPDENGQRPTYMSTSCAEERSGCASNTGECVTAMDFHSVLVYKYFSESNLIDLRYVPIYYNRSCECRAKPP